MPKSVISLVKELGAKNTTEVLELLRQVGVDVEAEGFGVMSKVEDDTITRLHALKSGVPSASAAVEEPAARKARPARRRLAEDEPVQLDLNSEPKRKEARKDFFGTRRQTVPATPTPEEKEATPPPPPPEVVKSKRRQMTGEQRPAGPVQPAPTANGAPATPGAAAPVHAHKPVEQRRPAPADRRPKENTRPDLSRGPKIISMPDPEEVNRLRSQREAGAATTSSAPGAAKKKPAAKGRDKRKAATTTPTESDFSGRRRKIKEIAAAGEDDDRIRSRKRVFKISGQKLDLAQAVVPHLKISGEMSIRDIAKSTGTKVAEIVRFLMRELDVLANINYVASLEEIQLIAENFGIKHTISLDKEPEHELVQFEQVEEANLQPRPPVVTVMGHVDHGKTKLLDAIRLTNVVDGEAGGITQHIGAYMAEKKGKHIAFIDTPGHEAFTAMRARGSQVTDIVILVVAADDGVMPQTIEAIDHAKAAGVPIIVAVNKIDKAEANPDRVKNQLSERGLVSEEWGGDTVFCHVSALKKQGLDELLEMILLTAELVDPKADPTAPPSGVVIESKVDTGIGVVATVLVQQGTLAKGQFLLSGTHVGRIRRMENERGEEVQKATPSVPVQIIGFSEPPENGDKVYAFMNKKQVQAIADQRIDRLRAKATATGGAASRISLEAFYQKQKEGEVKDLNVIIKADVGGSAEALEDALKKIEVEGAKCNVVSAGVGQINESDVNLAAASNAVIIGFAVPCAQAAKRLAEQEHVDVRLYDIIYKVTEDIESAMKGLLEPVYETKAMGRLEVRAIFKQDKGGTVAGGYVLDGVVKRNAKYNLVRGKERVLEEQTLSSLKRFKDDVREVASGYECGLYIDNVNVHEGDILELYEMVEKARI
jgi:translation initiation factor IF-2